MDQHSDSHALINALKHPLRRQILRAIPQDETTSPRELADLLEKPLGDLSYHVRVLARCGALELVGEKQVRGTMQHFYRSSVKAGWVHAALQEMDGGATEGAS